jgi:hypothetical protein
MLFLSSLAQNIPKGLVFVDDFFLDLFEAGELVILLVLADIQGATLMVEVYALPIEV